MRTRMKEDTEAKLRMTKTSLFLLAASALSLLDTTAANNFVLPGIQYPSSALIGYAPIQAVLAPDCDKKDEGSSSSSEESKEGEESKSSSEEGGESKSSSEEKGESKSSSEEGESKEKEGESSSEESGEKKEEGKKEAETKYVFPPSSYAFPARQIMYSPLSSYNYMPYQPSYVMQQPLRSYSYVSVPTVAKSYAAPVVSRVVASPVARIVYSAYPSASKTIVSPGAGVYSGSYRWNSPLVYYSK